MDEKDLVDLLRLDPDRGIEIAVEKYSGLVKSVILSIMGYRFKEDVDDLISEVFFKLWKNSSKYDNSKGSLKNYIAAMSRNEAVSFLRKKGSRPENIGADDNIEGSCSDAYEQLCLKEQKKIVNEIVSGLEEPDREIFIRRFYFAQRVKEIAKFLKTSEKFIENRLFRGKKKLRDRLIERGIF